MRKRWLIPFLCAVILLHIVGCAPWVDQLDRSDEKNAAFFREHTLYKDEDFNVDTFTNYIDKLYDEANATFHMPEDPMMENIEMAFVHLSDVQIRDERVKLFGKNVSRTFDNIIHSFEHSIDQEHYDYAAYLAIIKTINALLDDTSIDTVRKPKFMIHTGDAVDASVVEELYEFVYISNKLAIPWYNVLGNHDVTVFGNFNNKKVYVNDPNLTFQTLHNKYNFINMHADGYLIDPNINPGPAPTEPSIKLAKSRYHGFDLFNINKNQEYDAFGTYLCKDCPGYYSFKLRKVDKNYEFVSPSEKNPPPNPKEIVFIVLNTTTTQLGFAKGTVDKDQLRWLENEQLKKNNGKLIFVFGHHPLDGPNFLDNSYEKLIELFHQYHVTAYFCGHTHTHQIRLHEKNGTKQGFWEVITDSILEYPQEGSLVTIRKLDNGTGAIDVQSFRRNITNDCQLKQESDRAFKGAETDHPRELSEQDRNARLTFNHPYFSN
ncbi:MAG: metallophosphoesterase family protein [Candidatus Brocadiales bacterium]